MIAAPRTAPALPRLFHRLQDVARCHRVLVLSQPLRGEPPHELPPETVIEELRASDWPALDDLAGQRRVRPFRRAAARGRTCLVARRRGVLVGYVWLSPRLDDDLETYSLPLPARAAYLWHIFVEPSQRGSGTAVALYAAALRTCRERGFERLYWVSRPSNTRVLRIARRKRHWGLRPEGQILLLKVLRRRWSRFVPLRAGAGGGTCGAW